MYYIYNTYLILIYTASGCIPLFSRGGYFYKKISHGKDARWQRPEAFLRTPLPPPIQVLIDNPDVLLSFQVFKSEVENRQQRTSSLHLSTIPFAIIKYRGHQGQDSSAIYLAKWLITVNYRSWRQGLVLSPQTKKKKKTLDFYSNPKGR